MKWNNLLNLNLLIFIVMISCYSPNRRRIIQIYKLWCLEHNLFQIKKHKLRQKSKNKTNKLQIAGKRPATLRHLKPFLQ
jgi:hypothetical protein